MAIQIEHPSEERMIVIRASGTLTTDDYDAAVPEIEHAIKSADGPLRVLLKLEGFKGWEIGALWREIEFDLKYLNDFGRIAVIGDNRLEDWGTSLSAPFTQAEMRFFPTDKEGEAKAWLQRSDAK